MASLRIPVSSRAITSASLLEEIHEINWWTIANARAGRHQPASQQNAPQETNLNMNGAAITFNRQLRASEVKRRTTFRETGLRSDARGSVLSRRTRQQAGETTLFA